MFRRLRTWVARHVETPLNDLYAGMDERMDALDDSHHDDPDAHRQPLDSAAA